MSKPKNQTRTFPKGFVTELSTTELVSGGHFGLLEPGTYKIHNQMTENKIMVQIIKDEMQSDEIIDLPTPAYVQAITELESFLSDETRKTYKDLGYLYKRSWLFHGIPGTGKSVLVKRFTSEVAQRGGIVFSNLGGIINSSFNQYFHPFNREQLMCLVVEEFEGIKDSSSVLTALDGGTQRDNMIFLCTTNHIEQIPPRMLRPGRIHSKIEVGPLNFEGRLHYISTKLSNPEQALTMAQASEGLVIDEIKELIQQSIILKRDPVEASKELLNFRTVATERFYDPLKDKDLPKTLVYNKQIGNW